MPAKIELLKVRDFGEIITDTFVFGRQNFKMLVKCFFVFCGFFMLAGALLLAFQQTRMLDSISSAQFGPSESTFARYPFSMFSPAYFFALSLMLLGYLILQMAVMCYMAVYKEKGNIPATLTEVWGYVKYYFWRILLSAILIWFLTVAAFGVIFFIFYSIFSSNPFAGLFLAILVCIVPFVYLSTVMSLIFPIMVFENGSLGYAFSRSFTIIKSNWWATFGALIIISLITWIASFIVILPVAILNAINLLMHFGKGTPVSLVMSIISTVFEALSHILYIVPIITVSLCYFNLTERREGEGMLGRISQLGVAVDTTTIIEEDTREEDEEL